MLLSAGFEIVAGAIPESITRVLSELYSCSVENIWISSLKNDMKNSSLNTTHWLKSRLFKNKIEAFNVFLSCFIPLFYLLFPIVYPLHCWVDELIANRIPHLWFFSLLFNYWVVQLFSLSFILSLSSTTTFPSLYMFRVSLSSLQLEQPDDADSGLTNQSNDKLPEEWHSKDWRDLFSEIFPLFQLTCRVNNEKDFIRRWPTDIAILTYQKMRERG